MLRPGVFLEGFGAKHVSEHFRFSKPKGEGNHEFPKVARRHGAGFRAGLGLACLHQ